MANCGVCTNCIFISQIVFLNVLFMYFGYVLKKNIAIYVLFTLFSQSRSLFFSVKKISQFVNLFRKMYTGFMMYNRGHKDS